MDVFFKVLIVWSFFSLITLVFVGSNIDRNHNLKDVILNLNKIGIFFILLFCIPLLCLAIPFIFISLTFIGIGAYLRDLIVWLRYKFFKDDSKSKLFKHYCESHK